MSTDKSVDLSLLDRSIDDIEDLPGFGAPVAGTYTLSCTVVTKVVPMKGKDTSCVEAAFEVIECLEKNDPSDEENTPAGTKFSMLFQLENPTALAKMKEFLTPLAVHFGERNLGVLITEHLKEPVIISAVCKRRADKQDADKFYPVVSQVSVA
jgi:hypothetical protein